MKGSEIKNLDQHQCLVFNTLNKLNDTELGHPRDQETRRRKTYELSKFLDIKYERLLDQFSLYMTDEFVKGEALRFATALSAEGALFEVNKKKEFFKRIGTFDRLINNLNQILNEQENNRLPM